MTRSTEQLRERVRTLEIALQSANWEAAKADLLCLKELLVLREAQPVAWTDREELAFVNDMACMWTKGMGINEVPLYTAPPAPAVPTEEQLIAFAERHRLKLCKVELLQIWEDAISLAAAPTPTRE